MADKFTMRPGAIRQLLTSPEAASACVAIAQRIAAAAGPGNKVTPVERGHNRVRVAVVTATFDAMYDEATSRALTRAAGAGRR